MTLLIFATAGQSAQTLYFVHIRIAAQVPVGDDPEFLPALTSTFATAFHYRIGIRSILCRGAIRRMSSLKALGRHLSAADHRRAREPATATTLYARQTYLEIFPGEPFAQREPATNGCHRGCHARKADSSRIR
jgi:hypothetical protein